MKYCQLIHFLPIMKKINYARIGIFLWLGALQFRSAIIFYTTVVNTNAGSKIVPYCCFHKHKYYLVDLVNMATKHTTEESSWQFSISENCIKLCVSLFLLPFLITLEPLSSGLHLKSSLPFSSLTISASTTPFILLWRQANLVLCVCSRPQKLPGLPVSPASSTSWWNPYRPFYW